MKKLKTIIVTLMVYCMAVFPAMADLTVDNLINVSLGNKKMMIAQVDFDTSYAFGGESFDYVSYGFRTVDSVKFFDGRGFTFEYDYTNKKVKVFGAAPPIVYEEKHTLGAVDILGTTTQAQLRYPAAYIMNIASATANYAMLSQDSVTGTGEINVELYEGTPGTRALLTANSAQASETIYVTYVTQAWRDVFANLVVDEAHAFATTGAALSYTPIAIMYLDAGAAVPSSTNLKMLYSADTPAAGEASIDFTYGATGWITSQASYLTGLITYIKKPTSGFLADKFVDSESAVMATGVSASTWPILLWGTAGYLPDGNSVGLYAVPSVLMMAGDGLGTAGEGYIDWFKTSSTPSFRSNHMQTNATVSTRLSLSYVKGLVSEIPGLVPLEIIDGESLSHVTDIRVEVIGH